MKKRRQMFEAEVAEIRRELLAIGARGQAPPTNLVHGRQRNDGPDKAKADDRHVQRADGDRLSAAQDMRWRR